MEDFVKPLSKVVYDIINQEALKLNLMIEEIAWVREHNHNYLRIIASIGQRDDTIPTISLSLIHRAFIIAGIVFLVVSGLMPEIVISWLR